LPTGANRIDAERNGIAKIDGNDGSGERVNIDIAAPGVDTYSLAPGGGFSVMSGTSFATPHVSGAAALYIAKHGRVGPNAVRAGLLAEREKVHIPGDPDGIDEGIVNVGDLQNWSVTLGASKGKPRDQVTFRLTGFQSKSTISLKWDSNTLLTVPANNENPRRINDRLGFSLFATGVLSS